MIYIDGTKALVKAIQDLSATRSMDEIADIVRKTARQIAAADGATFVLRDNEMCSYVDEDAISPLWKGQKFPMSACVSGWAMLNKEQVVIQDIYQDPRVPADAYRPTFVKSMAMTPIRKEHPIGAIGTYWKDFYLPTEDQKELLQALADSVSIALENLRLYSNLNSHIENLRNANQAKDEFLMNVSHELRTPLNSILGWSEILLKNPLDEETKLGMETILRNAKHQLKIVEDLLDSSRILAGRLYLEPISLDLCQIITQSVLSLKSEILKKNLDFQIESSLSSAVIVADMVRVRQIVDNILMNAIKFSRDRGRVQIRLEKKGPAVEMAIRDEGEGIDPSFMPHLFQRLQQADTSLTRKHGGLGLGLSIAKHLAHSFDGEITAESDGLGHGSTFRIRFPLQDFSLKARQVEKIEEKKGVLRGMRILVVDDDYDSRHVIEKILERYGAEVHHVDSVEKALKVNRAKEYEAIVCDLSMPEEDGFSLVTKIRQGRTPFPTKIPLMALTAFADDANKEKALAEGFNQFIGKPFHADTLVQSLAQMKGAGN